MAEAALDVDFVEQKTRSGLDLTDIDLEEAWREVKQGDERNKGHESKREEE
eukprot:CAMPEP_0205920100 /NCGR_PEP_ID=MMETSP1325-20131115/10865_1 /ASSEMBLY_ACC=CAM_ASM_000708 /TAXON_ID=236786 /ORGANISM="Florenciella sp., Strain RCC1007" /LENGTH=50 /DNA_ID=CAMNT_0053287761 /DNA_START=108 /DNA_END=257 /DNA_ORIENTATION=+